MRRRILISAFAVSPHRGSEAGVGWNVCSRMGKYHDVVVLYGSHFYRFEHSSEIASHERQHGATRGVEFCAVAAPRLAKLCQYLHDKGLWALYYVGYRAWQRAAYREAVKLHRQAPFDLVHHLNMIGYREPGYMWKLRIPFVWGPVGGTANVPLRFASILGLRGLVFNVLRTCANHVQLRCSPRVRRAAARAAVVIAATSDTRDAFRRVLGTRSIVIPETGADLVPRPPARPRGAGRRFALNLVWSGHHIPRKALPLLLRALAACAGRFSWHLDVLGEGPLTTRWKRLAAELGVAPHCTWHGWQARAEALDVMERSEVFVLTSLQEGTTTVLMEALSLGLPVVCLDHCGMADVVTADCGVKIRVTSPAQVIRDLSTALIRLASDPQELARLGGGALRRAQEFSWERKVDALSAVYERVLSANRPDARAG